MHGQPPDRDRRHRRPQRRRRDRHRRRQRQPCQHRSRWHELSDTRDSECELDCLLAGTCKGRCEGQSRRQIQCTLADGCGDFACLDGSECRLQCAELQSCSFAECWDEPQECGEGVVICGSDCEDWTGEG